MMSDSLAGALGRPAEGRPTAGSYEMARHHEAPDDKSRLGESDHSLGEVTRRLGALLGLSWMRLFHLSL